MTDEALAELVRLAVRAEIERALQPLLPAPLDRRQAELLAALVAVFGSAPFTAGEALRVAATPMGDRRRLAAALQGASASDAQKLGLALAALEKRTRGRPVRLERAGTESGSRLWGIEGA